jgi:hypothetical protein
MARCSARWRRARARGAFSSSEPRSATARSGSRGALDAVADTIDRDDEHVRLARQNVEACGLAGHVVVHAGEFETVLPHSIRLRPRVLRRLHAEQAAACTPHAAAAHRRDVDQRESTHDGSDAYRDALLNERSWLTALIDERGETAISIKR